MAEEKPLQQLARDYLDLWEHQVSLGLSEESALAAMLRINTDFMTATATATREGVDDGDGEKHD